MATCSDASPRTSNRVDVSFRRLPAASTYPCRKAPCLYLPQYAMCRLLIGPELRQRSHCAVCTPFYRFVNKYPHKLADYMLLYALYGEML